jgi:hypothetical protein
MVQLKMVYIYDEANAWRYTLWYRNGEICLLLIQQRLCMEAVGELPQSRSLVIGATVSYGGC